MKKGHEVPSRHESCPLIRIERIPTFGWKTTAWYWQYEVVKADRFNPFRWTFQRFFRWKIDGNKSEGVLQVQGYQRVCLFSHLGHG